jgi:AAA+ superfamily predicted ATPase
LTAETKSEYTGKPLFPINIGELSTEKDIASRLETIFELASRWDAVLLMDEADVVLEKRSYENLQRNGVVSVFLRMLEYYRGILFLTTNRLGTMDIAFQSRVTLAIKYQPLTPRLRRQIWANFIERLSATEKEAKLELSERLDDIQEWDLNGRQIRNVITMAQSLALAERRIRGALRFEHVEQVAAETMRFQDYFDEEYRESRLKLGEMKSRGFQEKRVVPGMTGGGSGMAFQGGRQSPWS